MNGVQEKIYQHLSGHPYTFYFSNELMDFLDLSFSVLQESVREMAENNLVKYTEVSSENGLDFLVKYMPPSI